MGIVSSIVSSNLSEKESDVSSNLSEKEAEVSSNLSEKEADDRYEEFMKGGPCKEAYMNHENCRYKRSGRVSFKKLRMCIDAHSDYYQPMLDLHKSAEKFYEEKLEKDIMHSDTPIDDEEPNKFLAALMEDSCKESFTDWAVNCFLSDNEANLILPVSSLEKKKKNNEEVNCEELHNLFFECIDAHPDHSFYAVHKATLEHVEKEAKALFPEK